MTYAGLLADTATVTHYEQTGADRWNNPTWTVTGTDSGVPVRIDQASSAEDLADRDVASGEFVGFFLPGQALGPYDLVETAAERYRVVGPPSLVWGAGAVHHIEARLESLTSVDWLGYPA